MRARIDDGSAGLVVSRLPWTLTTAICLIFRGFSDFRAAQDLPTSPEFSAQSTGRRAATNGYDAVTLTTFRDVPWNMPFDERLGFRVIPSAELVHARRAIVEDERTVVWIRTVAWR